MIDLTPLDVRNKRGDFRRLMRGYDPQEVDVFLELVAERLEALVRENLQLRERTQTLQQQVTSQMGREQAVQDALVTAQELRADIKSQSQREADHLRKSAETEARRLIAEAEAQVRGKLRGVERQIEGAQDSLVELDRRRKRFLKDFRALLEREFDVVEVEESRVPLDDRAIDLDLGAAAQHRTETRDAVASVPTPEPPAPEPALDAATAIDDLAPDPVEVSEAARSLSEVGPSDAQRQHTSNGPARPIVASPWGLSTDERDRDDEEPTVGNGLSGTSGLGEGVAPPSELETPLFAARDRRRPGEADDADADGARYDELAASMEAEAVAQAQSEVVEVTGDEVDEVREVPRLEELLAEAGAELIEAEPESDASAEEIAPPRISKKRELGLLVYPDKDDARR